MAIPSSKATFKSYCLRALGFGVIDINVSDDQADDRIDEALQYFSQYHYDGIERMYLKHLITTADVTRARSNTTTTATDKLDSTLTADWLEGKNWIPVPDTVFLSGELVKEIFEKKYVPAEVLSHFKNKLLAIRPSPVIDLSTKNESFLYVGLDDQSYDVLEKRLGIKKAYEIYLSFLKMFSLTVYNLDIENCVELRNLLEHSKSLEPVLDESSSLDTINRIKQLISVETESQFPKGISQQLIEVINSLLDLS
mgnify:CR=1 FL=1